MFNTNQELKKWISNYIEEKGKKSLHIAINNSKEIKSDIIKLTNFLPDDIKINQRCYHILQDIIEIPLCKECKSKRVNFNNRNKDWIYLEFCSTKCSYGSRKSDLFKMNNRINIICKVCKKEFIVPPYKKNISKYCSISCRRIAITNKWRNKNEC